MGYEANRVVMLLKGRRGNTVPPRQFLRSTNDNFLDAFRSQAGWKFTVHLSE